MGFKFNKIELINTLNSFKEEAIKHYNEVNYREIEKEDRLNALDSLITKTIAYISEVDSINFDKIELKILDQLLDSLSRSNVLLTNDNKKRMVDQIIEKVVSLGSREPNRTEELIISIIYLFSSHIATIDNSLEFNSFDKSRRALFPTNKKRYQQILNNTISNVNSIYSKSNISHTKLVEQIRELSRQKQSAIFTWYNDGWNDVYRDVLIDSAKKLCEKVIQIIEDKKKKALTGYILDYISSIIKPIEKYKEDLPTPLIKAFSTNLENASEEYQKNQKCHIDSLLKKLELGISEHQTFVDNLCSNPSTADNTKDTAKDDFGYLVSSIEYYKNSDSPFDTNGSPSNLYVKNMLRNKIR